MVLIVRRSCCCIERTAQVDVWIRRLRNAFLLLVIFLQMLQVLVHSLLKKEIFPFASLFFLLLFSLLVFDLFLEVSLHLHPLLLFLTFNDVLLVSAAKNTSVLLKSNIESAFDNFATSHDRREVLLRQRGIAKTSCGAALLVGRGIVCILIPDGGHNGTF